MAEGSPNSMVLVTVKRVISGVSLFPGMYCKARVTLPTVGRGGELPQNIERNITVKK